jgi:class 3 adenylate cyclase
VLPRHPDGVRDLPAGTVTFLCSDIEGSTRLLDELGEERYAEALAGHRRLMRDAFAAHGGVHECGFAARWPRARRPGVKQQQRKQRTLLVRTQSDRAIALDHLQCEHAECASMARSACPLCHRRHIHGVTERNDTPVTRK